MLNLISWNKPLMVNGVVYKNSEAAMEALKDFDGEVMIHLNFKETPKEAPSKAPRELPKEERVPLYRIEVKQWMTQKATREFDLMKKINDDKPMPMRRMYGEVLEESKGMYRMRLHARAEKDSSNCSHCLRKLTNPVSMYYGIGPICGGHGHLAPPEVMEKIGDKEAIFKAADEKLREIVWEGWVVKSAITDMTQVGEVKKEVAV